MSFDKEKQTILYELHLYSMILKLLLLNTAEPLQSRPIYRRHIPSVFDTGGHKITYQ